MPVQGDSPGTHLSSLATGDCGCFRSRLYHASVAPRSTRPHLKIAFFFRKRSQGRSLGGATLSTHHFSLAEARLRAVERNGRGRTERRELFNTSRSSAGTRE